MNLSTLSRVFLPRVLSIPVLCGALMCSLPSALSGQTVGFNVAESVFGGFSGPAGIAVDSSGNVFVADYNANTVTEATAASGYTTLIPLGVANGHFASPYGIAVDANGNVFVADYGNSQVKEIVAPAYTAVNILGGTYLHPTGVAVDSNDNVYVADYGDGQVKLVPAPAYASASPIGSGFTSPFGVAVDAGMNVFVADFGANKVDEITAPAYTVVTPLGGGFSQPVGVAVDANENVFVGDYGNNLVKEILAAGGYSVVNTLDGTYASIRHVAVDGNGDVFVADYGGGKFVELQTVSVNFGKINVCQPPNTSPSPCSLTLTLRFDVKTAGTLGSIKVLTSGGNGLDFKLAAGSTCTGAVVVGRCTANVTFAPLAAGLRQGEVEILDTHSNVLSSVLLQGIGKAPEIAFDPAARVNIGHGWQSPSGVALDGTGDLVVADSLNQRIVEFPISGPPFVVGHGFIDPVGVAVDGSGNIYVADEGLSQVVEIVASNGSQINLGTGLAFPAGVAVDGFGNVFISDPGNSRVVELPAVGGPQFDVGVGLSTPVGLAVDGLGDLFIADPGLSAVIEVWPGGQSIVGTGLSAPYGVAVDAAGNIYVADSGNNRIEEILASSQISLDDHLNNPLGLVLDPAGDVFVAETGHDRVLVLPRSQAPSLTFADTYVTQTSSDSPQTVGVQNIGNQLLVFPKPLTGFNPSISPGFTIDPGTTCPIVSHSSALPGGLYPGGQCNLVINFSPVVSGNIHGNVILTDNTFNFNPAVHQTINLFGHALALFHTHVNLSLASTFLTYPGQTNLTACVTSNFSGPPTGSVLIYDGVNLIDTLALGGDGCAYWYISPGLSAGIHHLTAAYPGQLPYSPSTSPIVTVNVNPVTVNVSVSCWNPTFAYGANYYCTVSASSNNGAPPGNITFKYDSNPVVLVPLSSGTATFTVLKPNAGNHTVIVNYPGAPNYAPSGPFTENFTVDPAPVNVQLVPSSWYQSAGFAFTFTATVTSWSAGPPSHNGVVSFYDGAHLIGTVPVDHHGVASVTTHLHQGTHTITATYSGGTNYATGSGTATVTASH
jgi:streptogramin lyase